MKDYIASLGSLALAIFVYISSAEFAEPGNGLANDPAYYPKILVLLLVVMAVILLINTLRTHVKPSFSADWRKIADVVKVFVVMCVYVIAINYIGFLIATFLFVPGCIILFGGKPKLAILSGIPITIIVYFAFAILLKVPLPQGVIFG
ncbi:MAG: tripartite tricarboxylate transporter TctB family protein [Oscillospiraceae bacterium]